ncbi:PREDICTED: uncharacterized protein LOC104821785 [Tarenaya hassleriana]|uniref:uncharacterized protein LOC104821785 n=1 Tax=Tarenaya hassleriana TaxID=28532 RepID=UPI00053C8FFB|nr:PREDICTED: uncharacterized protein LOC104821785 [Tarenaya hassleriana]
MNALSLHFLKPPISPLRFLPRATARAASSAQSIQAQTLEVLEWRALCNQLSPFTSTTMGLSTANNAEIPVGKSPEESRRLLNETEAALAAMEAMGSRRLDLSKVIDVSKVLERAMDGQLLTVRELCAVRSTLMAARSAFDRLQEVQPTDERIAPLVEILKGCDFETDLEQKIGFCIDCNLSVILDRASEDLEIIRAERKRNMENLDSLLKEEATRIFQAGGVDRPLITQRRSRMCVAIRASHKHLLPGGVILSVSSSRATCYMEPKEAVELNNLEVRLANSEKDEEVTILSFLTSEVSDAGRGLLHLLDRILEVDIAFARASHAIWINGVYPSITSKHEKAVNLGGNDESLAVDIDSVQHPLLLGSKLGSPKDENSFPVPIDIKVESGTKVVVISGPNTGGKTALLKTLGLISLMSKSGMYLPAKNCPRLPWFDLILADVGDPQSLEQNLSTFSGHISRICQIIDLASEKSLVLLDEICSGTDPSEGVALATSILQYVKKRVNLAVVTTHYGDLSRLKDNEPQFQNAAMEFSMETLQPTFRVLWGSIGDSNALSIATSIGFNRRIIEHAHKWMEKLKPEQELKRKGLLFQSLVGERNRLNLQATKVAALHSDVMNLYHEIRHESDDLDQRERALRRKETQRVQQDLDSAKLEMQKVVVEFEDQLKVARPDQYNSLIRKTEMALAEIIKSCSPSDFIFADEADSEYSPQKGDQVLVIGLGDKIATVVEDPRDDETILVQRGKIRVRMKRNEIKPVRNSKTNQPANVGMHPRRQLRREFPSAAEEIRGGEAFGPRVQTSKNTMDLRGMRVEEAIHQLEMAISGRESGSILFIVHGMGTGVLKENVLERLRKHRRVSRYEEESAVNHGCTVAYIK